MGKENLSTRDLLDKLDSESEEQETEDSDAVEELEDTEEPEGEAVDLDDVTEGAEQPEEPETDEGEVPPDDREPVEAQPQPVAEEILAPYAMSPEERKQFAQLPPQQQAFMARRVKDLEKGVNQLVSRLSQESKSNQGITEVLQRHGNRLARFNMQPAQVIDRLLAWDEALQQDPIGATLQFIQSYGVHPQHLMAAAQDPQAMQMAQQQQQAPHDPRVDQILAAQQHEKFVTIQATKARWMQERDSNGALKYPYAEELEDTMAKCVPGLKQEDPTADLPTLLTRAYNRALEYYPELKESLAVQREAARKKAQLAAQRKRTQEAKRAAITPRTSSGGQKPYTKKKYKDTRDYLAALDSGEEEAITT